MTDKGGASVTKHATVTVNPKLGIINNAPTLEVGDKPITQGDTLDLMSLVVSAKDTEDGDLTKDVKLVDNGGFDKDKVGTYTVIFKVTDKGGASVTKHATVTVSKKDNPQGVSAKTVPQTGAKVVPQAASVKAVPQTGDSANGLLYAALMGLPGVSLLAAGLRKRRKQH